MKFHPRIYPANYPLLRDLSPNHPAVCVLQTHAEASDICVGKEIDWPDKGIEGIDQVWFSDADFREKRFSDLAYEYISYDLYLDGWIESAPEWTEAEVGFLDDLPKMRKLLAECERAAREEKNEKMIPLIEKAGEFFDALERSIRYRFEQFGITAP